VCVCVYLNVYSFSFKCMFTKEKNYIGIGILTNFPFAILNKVKKYI